MTCPDSAKIPSAASAAAVSSQSTTVGSPPPPLSPPAKLPLRPTPTSAAMLENGISQFMQFRQAAAAAHANAQADLLSRLGRAASAAGGPPASGPPPTGGALPRLPPLPLPFPFLHAMAAQQQQKFGHPGSLLGGGPLPPPTGSPPPLPPPLTAGLSTSSPGGKNNNNNTISPASMRSPHHLPGGPHSPPNTNVPNFQDVRSRLPFVPHPSGHGPLGAPGVPPPSGMSPLQASPRHPPSQSSPRSNSYPDEPMSPNGMLISNHKMLQLLSSSMSDYKRPSVQFVMTVEVLAISIG